MRHWIGLSWLQSGKYEATGVTFLGAATGQLELLKDGHEVNEVSLEQELELLLRLRLKHELEEEFDRVRREDLPKYEEQLELKIAKAQLEELKKDAIEAMETQKKREEFNDDEMVVVKSLDLCEQVSEAAFLELRSRAVKKLSGFLKDDGIRRNLPVRGSQLWYHVKLYKLNREMILILI